MQKIQQWKNSLIVKYNLIYFLLLVILISCSKDNDIAIISNSEIEKEKESKNDTVTIVNRLANNYQQLPEKQITKSKDGRFYAQYALPSERYGHGILGDKIEAGQLVVVADSVFYEFTLAENYVFEDIRPRLYDVDGDDVPEIITIRTNVLQGGGIVIYKIGDNKLLEYAKVPDIGRSFRWLNIVAINDLDNDGMTELVWIETPHIGGTLKVAKIKQGTLEILHTKAQYSNHAIGERNLCLSVLTQQSDKKVFYVPNQNRSKIIGFTFKNNQLEIVEEITQSVDFSKPLVSQYPFTQVIEEGNHCN